MLCNGAHFNAVSSFSFFFPEGNVPPNRDENCTPLQTDRCYFPVIYLFSTLRCSIALDSVQKVGFFLTGYSASLCVTLSDIWNRWIAFMRCVTLNFMYRKMMRSLLSFLLLQARIMLNDSCLSGKGYF